ncbi:hypothetical protein SODALDRAFT_337443 [Sodiomyces alkalinus F11]|uniref:Autophagy-related protein 29 n=1 Tax=Sodiomyces alkalinus (strain CBS 110278 / VKM F-3762 / F11) TaxID=1314773 RepID=A0A3N2PLQ0_SODAK|nr:hypothetical protein SODALDRAFT_337443 [Sodiomyces alkalinus F11]ROT35447.1 hypothetical protein SODALDRAFT_337443 [Sodiomyces alkalinus F11]
MVDPNFTVYIRLPIPRGDFVDPPPIDWDSSKDDTLWSIVSGAAKTEIDSLRFAVTVPFLLQQAAYLTERHASQVRAQVRKATAAAKGSAAPSPVPMSEHPTQHARAISALSLRRDSRIDGSGVGTPVPSALRPNVSRNPSANTAVHVSVNAGNGTGGSISSPRTKPPPPPSLQQLQLPQQKQRHRLASLPVESPQSPGPASPSPDDSSSFDSSEDSESPPAQSRIIRRPPRFQPAHRNEGGPRDFGDDDDDDETDAEPAFAAQPTTGTSNSSVQDLASTIRGDPATSRRPDKGKGKGKEKEKEKEKAMQQQPETSDSSATSSPALPSRGGPGGGSQRRAQGQAPLSPRRTMELAAGMKSPSRREGSDGTPSMGSSFSDLDDASITQSALEEAIASKMQDGAMGSRFSITQAFRSRYTTKGGGNQR